MGIKDILAEADDINSLEKVPDFNSERRGLINQTLDRRLE